MEAVGLLVGGEVEAFSQANCLASQSPCRGRKSELFLYLCEKQAMRGWFWKNSQDRRPSGLCGRKLGAGGGGSLSEALPKALGSYSDCN